MKNKYIDIMEKVLSAYNYEHIESYFNKVKKETLSEHGFPRLTANIGILIAHKRRLDLLPIFLEMMEYCCKTIPTVLAANDFSVREIVCCLNEIEKSEDIDKSHVLRFKEYLKTIDPYKCYNVYAKTPEDTVYNWAIFTALSEFFRQKAGLCDSREFIDIQIESQFKRFDENGMYMDNAESEINHPFVYDLVSRGLLTLLLSAGYRGKHYERLDAILKKAGLLTLKMQSVSGEIPFGGRSNQFLHNEAWLASICEYEAKRYKNEGDLVLAGKFKAAAKKALSVIETWLKEKPISHIKNRFPIESKFGCEDYAYFDKYMITAASFLYTSYLNCDTSIEEGEFDISPDSFLTSYRFHKLFLKAHGYFLEFDLNADPHYDAKGLGRIHKMNAPSQICISVPCSGHPIYNINIENPAPLSICPGIINNGDCIFATGNESKWEVINYTNESAVIKTEICGKSIFTKYEITPDFVEITAESDSELLFLLPALYFDGKNYADISTKGNVITVDYQGHKCIYETDAEYRENETLSANRNGYYKSFTLKGEKQIKIKITLI